MRTYSGRFQTQPRHRATVDEIIAGGHFRDNESRAQRGGQPPKRRVGNARHRREQHPIGHLNITYSQWLSARSCGDGHGLLVVLADASSRRPGSILKHKSCAVKLHAYTLDNSHNLASALQQNSPFPQLSGIVLFSRDRMIWAVRRPRLVCHSATQNHQF
jgi:hypothetical protein